MGNMRDIIHLCWGFIAAHEIVRSLFAAICVLGFMLTIVLVVIWMERKVAADIQSRIGVIRTGGPFCFLLQSMSDALKLLLKEDLRPTGADRWPFYVAPYLVFLPAFMAYLILPFSATWVPQNLKVGILFYSAISSVPVLGIVMAGWASNNKWSLLGGMRASAQLISYEIPLAMAILAIVLLHGTLETSAIVQQQWHHWWLAIVTLPSFLIFLTAGLAEVSRTPFDLPEAESELVSGFNTEYSGMRFSTFFLAEFSASFFISALAVTLFLGGWSLWGLDTWGAANLLHLDVSHWDLANPATIPFVMKVVWFGVFMVKSFLVLWILMWIKWTLPRLRIDQVLNFGWKVLLPIGLLNLLVMSVAGLYIKPFEQQMISLSRPTTTMSDQPIANGSLLLGLTTPQSSPVRQNGKSAIPAKTMPPGMPATGANALVCPAIGNPSTPAAAVKPKNARAIPPQCPAFGSTNTMPDMKTNNASGAAQCPVFNNPKGMAAMKSKGTGGNAPQCPVFNNPNGMAAMKMKPKSAGGSAPQCPVFDNPNGMQGLKKPATNGSAPKCPVFNNSTDNGGK